MAPAGESDAILSRFPGPVTLYRARGKWLLILLGCGLFTAGGIGMVAQGAANGWFVLIVFAFGTIIAAVMLLPGAGALTLDGDGFQVTSLFRRRRSRWQDAAGFEPGSIPPAREKFVLYDDAVMAIRRIAKLNVAIAGHNAALPDTYGLAAGDLARLMIQWRGRALARG